MPVEPLQIQGLRELTKAFRLADRELSAELRSTLREVANPVRWDAERLAVDSIPRIGFPWSRMRVGVTQREVYVAPKQRGVKSRSDRRRRRPNLFDLLLERSLEPALADNQEGVVRGVERLLAEVAKDWERA